MGDEAIIGDWMRCKILGSGSFGIVSLWLNSKSKAELAIKICKFGDDVQLTQKHRERWTKEVEMMKTISSVNIVATRDIPPELAKGLIPCNVSELPILCMEYCNKGDLRQILNQPDWSNGLPESEVRCVLNDMKNAISHLHKLKITHRDLKPENIVLQDAGENWSTEENSVTRNFIYKLIDLGYAKEIDSNSVCASFVGTLQYLAPELLYSKTYSNTVDYWSFGLLAFEIICGVRPFLPNMPPVQWMTHIKRKTSEQICAFEKIDGEIEFSSSIFQENYISRCLKKSMEKWLKIALEWDPKKRGHGSEEKSVKFNIPGDSPEDSESFETNNSAVEIFSLLDKILAKKILKIFCLPTYEYLSYEVTETTPIKTLQEWMERDTKVPVDKQILVSAQLHRTVNQEGFARDHWEPHQSTMLYLFQSDCSVHDGIKPQLPGRIAKCFENFRQKVTYNYYLSAVCNSVYFIKTEEDLYNSLIKAYILRVDSLKDEIKVLEQKYIDSDKSMCQLFTKHILLSDIITLDEQKLEFVKNPAFRSAHQSWLSTVNFLDENILKLKDAFLQITTRLQSINRRCNEIGEKDVYSTLNTVDFNKMRSVGTSLVATIRRIPKESRNITFPCVDGVKLTGKCIKLRQTLLNSIGNKQIGQKILDIHLETEKISRLIAMAGVKAEDLSSKLSNFLMEREKLMWKYVIMKSTAATSFFPCTPELQKSCDSAMDFRIGEAVRGPPENLPSRNTEELESLIKENQSLHIMSTDFIKKSKSIQLDMLCDFNFLK